MQNNLVWNGFQHHRAVNSESFSCFEASEFHYVIFHEVPQESGSHTTKSNTADLNKVVTQLFHSSKVFTASTQRAHKQFPKFTRNVMLKLNHTDLKYWMEERSRNLHITENCSITVLLGSNLVKYTAFLAGSYL